MNLLNSKSILDCDEHEEELHNQEITNFIDRVYNFENYECALRIQRMDIKKMNLTKLLNHVCCIRYWIVLNMLILKWC